MLAHRSFAFFAIIAASALTLTAAPRLVIPAPAVGPLNVFVGSNPGLQSVDTYNAGDGTLNLTFTPSVPWISALSGSPHSCAASASPCTPINIAMNTASLAAGIYKEYVTVRDPNAVDSPQRINVTINVGGVPDTVILYAPANGVSGVRAVLTQGTVSGAVSTQSGGNWLTFMPPSTPATGASGTSYGVQAAALPGMAPGKYTGSVTLSGSSFLADNRIVPVTLIVSANPIIQVGYPVGAAQEIQLHGFPGGSVQTALLPLNNLGSGNLKITAASVSPAATYLQVSVTSSMALSIAADPGKLAPGIYKTTISLTSNADNNSDISIPVEFEIANSTLPEILQGGVVNIADYQPVVSQGDIVALFGDLFAPAGSAFTNPGPPPLAQQLSGVQVLVNGVPAPLFYVSQTQINFQMPFELPADQLATVQVVSSGMAGNIRTISVVASGPRILLWSPTVYSGNRGIVLNLDGTLVFSDASGYGTFASRPAKPGDTLVFYGVGFGQTNPPASTGMAATANPLLANSPASVLIADSTGKTSEVQALFAGLVPTTVGLYQMNLTLPLTAPTGDSVPVTLKVNGITGNTINLPISGALAVSATNLPNGTVGAAYSASVGATGGVPAYTFSATGLPAGLTINARGQITGTPTAAGASTVVVSVTDSTLPTHLVATGNVSISIVANVPALVLSGTTLPAGAVGAAYTAAVTATGGVTPYTFTATGLPAGLTMSSGGQITGVPTVSGTASVVITVTDSSSPNHLTATANSSLTITTVTAPSLAISGTTLPGGVIGTAYASSVSATGGTAPYTFSATGLPAGLTINANGQITGIPTVAGTSTVAVTVTDSGSPNHLTASGSLTLTIAPVALVFSGATLQGGAIGVPYSLSLSATGGTPAYTFTGTGLPPGLTLSSTGQISGTPTTGGIFTAAVTVTDSTTPTPQTATANFILTINSGLAITTVFVANGTVGVPYSATVTGVLGTLPYTFSAVNLPQGLSMDANGHITGTPTTPGIVTATFTITDSSSPRLSANASLTIIVNRALTITVNPPANGTVGIAYSASVNISGGTLQYTVTATGLPAGLMIDNNGQITGTPTAAGTNTVTISATDSTLPTHQTVSTTLTITINPGTALAITTMSLANAVVGAPYSATVTAVRGTMPYTFSATGLPAGLSISASGAISGMTTAAGTSSVVLTVTDSTTPTAQTATVTIPLISVTGPSITNTALANGAVGVAYTAQMTASGGTLPYTFTATGLPSGLAITTNGQIAGTPTTAGTSTVVITVSDSSSPTHLTGMATLTLTITGGLSITTTTLPNATAGNAYSAQIAASGGSTPYTFAATGLPAGLTISSTGLIAGTPTAAATSSIVITVTDTAAPTHATATATLALTTVSALSVTTTSLPNATAGAAYSAQIAASGGSTPYTFAATGLPAGLTISSSGLITGTPTAAATSSVVITVTDGTTPTHLTTNATLALTTLTALSVTSTSLPNATVGTAYSTQVTATGGTTPYTFAASGLPAGLSINSTGLITGTPTTSATSAVLITVTDGATPTHVTATATLALTTVTALSVTTTSLPNATVGAAYSTQIAATGGSTPYTFSATGLPTGLSISTAGLITGIPTAAATSSVVITVTDGATPTHITATATLTLTTIAGLGITNTSLPSATAGAAYSAQITASGGATPYTFAATGLPTGLSISSTGLISGTPTAAATSSVAITVTDGATPTHATATATLTLTTLTALSITTTSLPNATAGAPYSTQIAATGGTTPYTFTATGLPTGLSISSTGLITGTPTAAATSSVVITVTDGATPTHVTATATLTLTTLTALSITTTSLPTATAGTAYSAQVAATGGTTPYTFAATGLPAGLSISSTGLITGTPTAAATSSVIITVTDGASPTHVTANATLALTTNAALTISTSSLSNGALAVPYNATVTATGGTAPYTFSATGLPANLSISSGGQITGTPAAAGTSSVVVTVVDGTNPTHLSATVTLSLKINASLAVTTTTLPNAVVGTAYSATVAATGGTASYTFSATGLPAGLAINGAGQITGTPTAAATATVAITVTDSTNPTHLTATASLPLIVNAALAVSTATLPNGAVTSPYTASIAATGGNAPYTFTVTGLPAGLSFANGQITGTPTTAGVSSVVITATDSTSPTHLTATATLPLTINAALGITTASLATGTVGSAYTTPLAATGGTGPYTFTAAPLPAGLSVNGGQIAGTPTAAGTISAVITVTDSNHLTATVTLPVTINAALAITTASLANGTAGAVYTTPLGATGGTSPYTFTATGLPAGLAISGSQITGTPTAAGTSTVVITATDSTNPTHLTSSVTLTLSIAPPPVVITTASLASGTAGAVYTAPLAATGGTLPYTFTATGLPAGLAISGSQITGTPTTAGTSTVVITATDATNPTHLTNTVSLTLSIAPPPVAITTVSLANGTVGAVYTTPLAATGGTSPYTFTATGLPAGLAISGSQITGTPTTAGTSTVVITATDSTNPTHLTKTVSLTLSIAPAPVAITTASLANGTAGAVYAAPLAATGGTTPYIFTATGLPAGLAISGSQITGTPTTSGTSSVVITATDATNPTHLTASVTLTLVVAPAPVAITTSSLASGTVGSGYTTPLAATGGTSPYTFTATGLPAGLGISGSQITGTPTTAGTSTVVVTATDSTNPTHLTNSVSLALSIAPPALAISASSVTDGMVGAAYTALISATGGTPSYTFTASGLPAGLTLGTNGQLTGAPTTAGTSTATFTVTDSTNPTHLAASVSRVITISPSSSAPSVTITGGTVGQNLEIPVAVTLNQPTAALVTISIASDNADVLLAAHAGDAGSNPLVIPNVNPTLASSFNVFAQSQGQTSSGSATLTVSAPGYASGTASVVIGPSGFVLAGPNGTGASFTSNQRATTPLTILAELLDSSGNPLANEQLSGQSNATLTLNNSLMSIGTVPASITFVGGTSSFTTQFVAGSTVGSTIITVNEPIGFTAPSQNANSVPVTVQQTSIMPLNATVGKNLATTVNVTLSGVPASDLQLTITSNDPTRLLLSTNPVMAGTSMICGTCAMTVTIKAGHTVSPDFYVYGLGNAGTVTYTVVAPGFGSADGIVSLGQSGFVLRGPNGVGQPFSTTTIASAPSSIDVLSALLDGSGAYVSSQIVAGGLSFAVNLTSSKTSVGTVPASVTFAGGTNVNTVQFQPAGSGTTVISAVAPTGFTTPAQGGSLTASVSSPGITIDTGNFIGNNLEQPGTILLGAFAPAGGLAVTLTVTSGQLSLSSTATAAGSAMITVMVPAGQSTATYYMYGQGISGTATVTATAPGFRNGTGTETLVPSGVVIAAFAGSPGFSLNASKSAGPAQVFVSTAILDPNSNTWVQNQALAGGLTLSVSLTNSDSTVGTVSTPVTITGGNDTGIAHFTPIKVGGSEFLSVVTPAGYTLPANDTTLPVNVSQ